MVSTVLNRYEISRVRSFFGLAISEWSARGDVSYLLYMIRVWEMVIPSDKVVIAKKMLRAITRLGVQSPVVVRGVLGMIGTRCCDRPARDMWGAVVPYLGSSHLLSVNIAAISASLRLIKLLPEEENEPYLETVKKCAESYMEHHCPEASEVSNELLSALRV